MGKIFSEGILQHEFTMHQIFNGGVSIVRKQEKRSMNVIYLHCISQMQEL